jgi:hypothetical protein
MCATVRGACCVWGPAAVLARGVLGRRDEEEGQVRCVWVGMGWGWQENSVWGLGGEVGGCVGGGEGHRLSRPTSRAHWST